LSNNVLKYVSSQKISLCYYKLWQQGWLGDSQAM